MTHNSDSAIGLWVFVKFFYPMGKFLEDREKVINRSEGYAFSISIILRRLVIPA